MKAISIIQAEHRNLGAVLTCFGWLVGEIEKKDTEPDFCVCHAIVHYLDSFLDRFHHPKEEEFLFPAICRRYPKAEQFVEGVRGEHLEDAELLKELGTALSVYESSATPAFTTFLNAARHYIDFERQHVYKEERELLPLAREQSDDRRLGTNRRCLFSTR